LGLYKQKGQKVPKVPKQPKFALLSTFGNIDKNKKVIKVPKLGPFAAYINVNFFTYFLIYFPK